MIVPKPKKSSAFRFIKVQEHQRQQVTGADIRKCIRDLARNLHQDLGAFFDCVEPGTVPDPARLPYQTRGPNSTTAGKFDCECARLSWIIQLYWRQCATGQDDTATIQRYLEELRQLQQHGIDAYRVTGDVRHGFWLEGPCSK